jgi:hypothetical protein
MSFETTAQDSFTKRKDARGEWSVIVNLSGQRQPAVFCKDEEHADRVIRELKLKHPG